MSRARSAGVAIIAVVFAAVLAWRLKTSGAAEQTPPAQSARAEIGVAEHPEPATTAKNAAPTAQPPPPEFLQSEKSLEQRFNEADDLLTFIDSLTPAARDGDGPSAWWIYRALQRCDTEYKHYFIRDGREITLDELLLINARNLSFPADEARKLHAQCGRLLETRADLLGAWIYWVSAAATRGVPLARIEMARQLLRNQTASSADTYRARARELAIEALRSKDPAVMAALSELAAVPREWILAACQRGLDCSPESEVVVRYCRRDSNCQPFEDFADILRRISPAEYDAIERSALEINRRIDQGRYEELVQAVLAGK